MLQWDIVNLAVKWATAFGTHLNPSDTYYIQKMTDECLDFILKNQGKSPAEINELLLEKWQKAQ